MQANHHYVVFPNISNDLELVASASERITLRSFSNMMLNYFNIVFRRTQHVVSCVKSLDFTFTTINLDDKVSAHFSNKSYILIYTIHPESLPPFRREPKRLFDTDYWLM